MAARPHNLISDNLDNQSIIVFPCRDPGQILDKGIVYEICARVHHAGSFMSHGVDELTRSSSSPEAWTSSFDSFETYPR